MFKRVTLAAVAAAFATVALPAVSEAGHHARSARADCPLTKLLTRTERAVHHMVRSVRTERRGHARRAR